MYPVLWEPFGFPISSFGVMVALAFLAGGWLSARSFELQGKDGKLAWDLLTWCVVGGLLGAKLWFVAEELAREPSATLAGTLFSRGGLTWYGGFLGGAIFGLGAGKLRGLSLLDLMNAAAPALAASQAIGRIGCFLVGDDYGVRSTAPWAVAFPHGLPPTLDPTTGAVFSVHPTMLYETLWLTPVFALLWARRGKSPFLFGEYLVLAGIGRLWIEVFRRNPDFVGILSNAQVVALSCVVVGAASWLWLRANAAAVNPGAAK
ncbi:MAG TPA: prolipoprotein diacylglyceryl transferase family protein [Myxococcota bacterium]|nr:prolipoprotein diacylglyceryl transferase family protein [Myxococcota bacterium]